MSNAEARHETARNPTREDDIEVQLAEFAVVDTTELRWFVRGPLPEEVRVWFTATSGVAEQRCDTYLLDGRHDTGVKRRSRQTLERKVRRRVGESLELGPGLAGALEIWRKWSPADGLVEAESGSPWVDVHKSVVKRRFAADGTELVYSPDTLASGSGCDVEVAAVRIGDRDWWTFAFAAFGPLSARRAALMASWQSLVAETPCPELFGPRTGRPMGYPEWLERAGATGSLEI